MNESLVAVEQSVPPGEQITFEPALALMLAQHFHHPAIWGQKLVVVLLLRLPLPAGYLKHGSQAVGERFVGAKNPEIPLFLVQFEHIAKEYAQFMRISRLNRSGSRYVDGVLAKVWHDQIVEQQTTISIWIGAHAAFALGRQLGQFRHQ